MKRFINDLRSLYRIWRCMRTHNNFRFLIMALLAKYSTKSKVENNSNDCLQSHAKSVNFNNL